MGRTTYNPEYCARVRELGKQGCSISGAGEKLGIHYSTLLNWEKRIPEFRKAFERIRANSER